MNDLWDGVWVGSPNDKRCRETMSEPPRKEFSELPRFVMHVPLFTGIKITERFQILSRFE